METTDKKEKHGKRCVAALCSNSQGVSSHKFPKSGDTRQAWVNWVRLKRITFADPPLNSQLAICGEHFTPDCFDNELAIQLGFQSQRRLKPTAVPTIHTEDILRRRGILPPKHDDRNMEDLPPNKKRQRGDGLYLGESCHPYQGKRFSIQDPQPSVPFHMFDNTEAAIAFEPPRSVNVGTQCSERKHIYFRSKMVNTDRQTTRDTGTQYDINDCGASVTRTITSTPIKKKPDEHREENTPNMSPVSSSPSSPEYKPSNLSIQEAKEDGKDSFCDDECKPYHGVTRTSEKDERKYLVFKSCLLSLFTICRECGRPTSATVVSEKGSLVQIRQKCIGRYACGYVFTWNSQPYIHQLPAGNLLISSAILLSGALPSQILKIFSFLNMAAICRNTYHRHQRNYVAPAIINEWKQAQVEIISSVQELDGGLQLSGDGRFDSPGHSAKYGGYSLIENRVNKVIDIQLVQSNEVTSSNACELEGLKRGIAFLTEEKGLKLETIVTDRHKQINAFLRDGLRDNPLASEMTHFYDVWHVSKGLGRKIDQLAKKNGCENIALWRRSIVNHLYYVAATSEPGQEDLSVSKWKSVANHVKDIHEHDDELFVMCDHGHLLDEDRKAWLVPETRAATLLEELVTKPSVLADVRRLSPLHQTSSLEAFHSLLVRFAPKHTGFMWLYQLARYYVAAMHFNENSDRIQARTAEGDLEFSIRYPKFKKGEYSVVSKKTEPTYEYVHRIMDRVMEGYRNDFRGLRDSINDIRDKEPPTLASMFEHPEKNEAVARHARRFREAP